MRSNGRDSGPGTRDRGCPVAHSRAAVRARRISKGTRAAVGGIVPGGFRLPVPGSRVPAVRTFLLVALLLACTKSEQEREASRLVVYNAGSLARPLRAALDAFAGREGVAVEQESAGSLETARKLTELGKVPDFIALADDEVFPQLLMPEHLTWYARFARNRMVLAFTDRSKYASEVTADNWWQVVQQPGVEVGRADPNLDPNGYRTLLTWQLAERHYRQPGLFARLERGAPERNVRPKEADLVGLLQAGEMDYVWSYESLAQAAGLRYVTLPAAIDLGTQADSAVYATATVRVTGRTPGDTVEFRGRPIVYGYSIPKRAPHPALAERFVAFLASDAGRAVLRRARLDALDRPTVVGAGAPAALAGAVPAPAAGNPR